MCVTGRWVFMPTYYIGHFFYKYVPGYYYLWRWYKNRPTQKKKWLNSFTDKKTGEKVNPFPNLK